MDKQLKNKLPGGRFHNVSPSRSKAMGAIKSRGNKSTEIRLKMALVRAGIRGWKLHVPGLPGNPDFYFPKEHMAAFVDGCFWHGCPICGHIPTTNQEYWKTKIRLNKKRDYEKRRELVELGIDVVRIWEHSLSEPEGIIKKLENKLTRHTE